MKVNTVFATKTKTHILNVFVKLKLSKSFKFCFQTEKQRRLGEIKQISLNTR